MSIDNLFSGTRFRRQRRRLGAVYPQRVRRAWSASESCKAWKCKAMYVIAKGNNGEYDSVVKKKGVVCEERGIERG